MPISVFKIHSFKDHYTFSSINVALRLLCKGHQKPFRINTFSCDLDFAGWNQTYFRMGVIILSFMYSCLRRISTYRSDTMLPQVFAVSICSWLNVALCATFRFVPWGVTFIFCLGIVPYLLSTLYSNIRLVKQLQRQNEKLEKAVCRRGSFAIALVDVRDGQGVILGGSSCRSIFIHPRWLPRSSLSSF